eukprot:g70292.t1
MYDMCLFRCRIFCGLVLVLAAVLVLSLFWPSQPEDHTVTGDEQAGDESNQACFSYSFGGDSEFEQVVMRSTEVWIIETHLGGLQQTKMLNKLAREAQKHGIQVCQVSSSARGASPPRRGLHNWSSEPLPVTHTKAASLASAIEAEIKLSSLNPADVQLGQPDSAACDQSDRSLILLGSKEAPPRWFYSLSAEAQAGSKLSVSFLPASAAKSFSNNKVLQAPAILLHCGKQGTWRLPHSLTSQALAAVAGLRQKPALSDQAWTFFTHPMIVTLTALTIAGIFYWRHFENNRIAQEEFARIAQEEFERRRREEEERQILNFLEMFRCAMWERLAEEQRLAEQDPLRRLLKATEAEVQQHVVRLAIDELSDEQREQACNICLTRLPEPAEAQLPPQAEQQDDRPIGRLPCGHHFHYTCHSDAHNVLKLIVTCDTIAPPRLCHRGGDTRGAASSYARLPVAHSLEVAQLSLQVAVSIELFTYGVCVKLITILSLTSTEYHHLLVIAFLVHITTTQKDTLVAVQTVSVSELAGIVLITQYQITYSTKGVQGNAPVTCTYLSNIAKLLFVVLLSLKPKVLAATRHSSFERSNQENNMLHKSLGQVFVSISTDAFKIFTIYNY